MLRSLERTSLKLSDQEKLKNIHHLNKWVQDNVADLSDTYQVGETALGADAMELVDAILTDQKVQWDTTNSLFNLMKEIDLPEVDEIWEFIERDDED